MEIRWLGHSAFEIISDDNVKILIDPFISNNPACQVPVEELNPDIILFDEPMSALDAEIKVVLRNQLKEIQRKLKITMIYVTHDQEEAFALSDRVMVLNDQRIVQLDTPFNLYHNPANSFVKRFIVDHLDMKVKSIEDSIR